MPLEIEADPPRLVREAEAFARERHEAAGQQYPPGSGISYAVHLEAVVGILREYGYGEIYQAAGWLHDVVEDTPTLPMDLRIRFGKSVAELVWAVTGRGDTRTRRNEAAYHKIRCCPALYGLDAATLKLADRLANLRAGQAAGPMGSRFLAMYREEWSHFYSGLLGYGDPRLWEAITKIIEGGS